MEKGRAVILSILTPAVPSRIAKIEALCKVVQSQIGDLDVEHLVLIDNKRRTVGEKRDALLRAARGRYVAFVDDDDEILPGYVSELVRAAQGGPDVITFEQEASVNGHVGIIQFGLGNPNEALVIGGTAKRNAWHICAWKRSIATMSQFPASNYGEDWAWAEKLCAIKGLTSVHIPKILHRYIHNQLTTEAPPPVTNAK